VRNAHEKNVVGHLQQIVQLFDTAMLEVDRKAEFAHRVAQKRSQRQERSGSKGSEGMHAALQQELETRLQQVRTAGVGSSAPVQASNPDASNPSVASIAKSSPGTEGRELSAEVVSIPPVVDLGGLKLEEVEGTPHQITGESGPGISEEATDSRAAGLQASRSQACNPALDRAERARIAPKNVSKPPARRGFAPVMLHAGS